MINTHKIMQKNRYYDTFNRQRRFSSGDNKDL